MLDTPTINHAFLNKKDKKMDKIIKYIAMGIIALVMYFTWYGIKANDIQWIMQQDLREIRLRPIGETGFSQVELTYYYGIVDFYVRAGIYPNNYNNYDLGVLIKKAKETR